MDVEESEEDHSLFTDREAYISSLDLSFLRGADDDQLPSPNQLTSAPPVTASALQSTPLSLQSSQSTPLSLQSSQSTPPSLQSSQSMPLSLQSSQSTLTSLQSSQSTPPSLQSSQSTPPSLQSSHSSLQSSQPLTPSRPPPPHTQSPSASSHPLYTIVILSTAFTG